jgi:hypothetical protein
MKDQEHREQVALFKALKLQERTNPLFANIFAIPNGGHRHIKVAAKLKAEGVKAGIPDIFVAVPNSYSAGLFIEMKVKPNRPSKHQKAWLERLEQVGYDCMVCYSWTDAYKAITDHIGSALVSIPKE